MIFMHQFPRHINRNLLVYIYIDSITVSSFSYVKQSCEIMVEQIFKKSGLHSSLNQSFITSLIICTAPSTSNVLVLILKS